MSRITSIALLLVFSFSLIAPLLALGQTADANVPVCCRRNGKHHCAMSMAESTAANQTRTLVGAPPEKCPYCPSSMATTGHAPLAFAAASTVLGTTDTLNRSGAYRVTAPVRSVDLRTSRSPETHVSASVCASREFLSTRPHRLNHEGNFAFALRAIHCCR
jgi:hypothetical protein